MRFLFWIIVIFCIYWMFHNYQDPAVDPSLVLSNPAAEIHRQEVIRTAKEHRMEGYPEYTDEERHIVLQREYERADKTPTFIIVVFLILLGSSWGAAFGRSSFSATVSVICCLILLVCGCYKWIVLAVFLDFVIIPTLFCMGIKGLFSK